MPSTWPSTAIILLLGAGWIAIAFGPEKALAWGVGPFIATDVIKAALAAAVVPADWQIANLFRR
ncbi:biotin transporter BioY [Hoeflea alexandrii]|uniref:biotin transporter BioY n=1 Tax=Hoeflea alexandrii TaxID=288436 RepID=UPI00226ECC4C|nr:biotin transporter BioY [Hoeflea alexandrii]MCY0152659.1 biotin transporter BioY [Hoeflea alexandrii]